MMQRRNFIAALMATATLDPERLLWVPGRKSIFIPPSPRQELIIVELRAVTAAGRYIRLDVASRKDVLRVANVMLNDAYNAGVCSARIWAADRDSDVRILDEHIGLRPTVELLTT